LIAHLAHVVKAPYPHFAAHFKESGKGYARHRAADTDRLTPAADS